jgi:hypothetical protein
MVICKKCGVDNPLGRVFCGGCGTRLELDRINMGTELKQHRPNWFRVHGVGLAVGLVVALLAVASLAFWPQSERIGEKPAAGGSSRMSGPLRAMAGLRPGQSIGRAFTEADINSLFSTERAKEMGIESLSVEIYDGFFNVRMVCPLPEIKLGSIDLQPKLSYDYACVPVGSVVRVRKAQKEWSSFENTTEIRAEKGKIWIKVAK